jgi:hypothetical protein
MHDDPSTELARIRRQCRRSAFAAVLILAASFCVAFPAALARRRSLQAANAELLGLQSQIVATQARIGVVQAKIVEAQARISAAVNGH